MDRGVLRERENTLDADAGVVDESIDPPEALDRLGREPSHCCAIRRIDGREPQPIAELLARRRDRRSLGAAEGGDAPAAR